MLRYCLTDVMKPQPVGADFALRTPLPQAWALSGVSHLENWNMKLLDILLDIIIRNHGFGCAWLLILGYIMKLATLTTAVLKPVLETLMALHFQPVKTNMNTNKMFIIFISIELQFEE